MTRIGTPPGSNRGPACVPRAGPSAGPWPRGRSRPGPGLFHNSQPPRPPPIGGGGGGGGKKEGGGGGGG
ncbi:hypothetical protein AAHZ94_31260, partial [Streptomyces sp. HSW2009]